MEKIKVAFFGSPDFAADFLKKILLDRSFPIEIQLVVTQADQPSGRKQILTPTPVKVISNEFKIPIFDSLKSKNPNYKHDSESTRLSSKLDNIDMGLVYAFGEFIPSKILVKPKYGFWNIHPSLLPKYRGTSPIASPLVNGDKITGVTIIKMDDKIDHGPIIAQEVLTIENDEKRPILEMKLTNLALDIFKKIIIQLIASKTNELKMKEQNHKLATYTEKLKKSDGFIPLDALVSVLNKEKSYENLFNLFRGLYPWPGIWTLVQIALTSEKIQKRLKITEMEIINQNLSIKKVQLEGKNEVDFETFNKAYKIFPLD